MNCIIYLLDGLSPLAIKNKKNKKFCGIAIKENYISKLQENSIHFDNAFGYGETFSTTYEFFTGKNIYKSYCDAFNLLTSFPKNKNLGYYFKKNNFNTFFFRDPHENHPTTGFYGRYFSAMTENFDFFCVKKKNKNYNFKSFFNDNKIDNFITKDKKNFFVFHDYTLHDNKKAYKNSTPKSYLEAVDISANTIKSNLDLIKYNDKKDTLIFLSDHGLNLKPYDELHYDKKISKEKYDEYYKALFLNEKIKFTSFIKGPGIKYEINKNYYKPSFIFFLLKSFAKKKLKKQTIKTLITKLKKNNKIIISLRSANQNPYNNFFLKNYFHCYFLLLGKYKNIVYSHNHKCPYFDMDNKKYLKKEKVERNFKKIIEEYFSLKNYFIKSILFVISIIIRVIKKILR